MYDVSPRSDIELDDTGHDSIRYQPSQHGVVQDRRKLPKPDEDDWNEHEGGRSQGADYIDVAGRHVEDAVEDIQPWGKEGRLPAEQHLVWTLQGGYETHHSDSMTQ